MAAPSWEELVRSDEYNSLDQNGKEIFRENYFQKAVVPDIPEGVDVDIVRKNFDEKTQHSAVRAEQEKYEEKYSPVKRLGMRLSAGYSEALSGAAAVGLSSIQTDLDKLDRREQDIKEYEAGKPLEEGTYEYEIQQRHPERYAQMLEEQKADIAKERESLKRRRAQALGAMKHYQESAAAVPRAPVADALARSKTFGEAWDLFWEAPVSTVAELGVRSAPQMILPITMGAAGGATMGPLGFAAGMGTGSATVERSASIAEGLIRKLNEQGVDVHNEEAVLKALDDPGFFESIKSDANARGIIIGALDAASGGLATKSLIPAKMMKNGLARELVEVTAQLPPQAGLGALGEAAAQYYTTKQIQAGEVAAEAIGELITSPGEYISATLSGARDATKAEINKRINADESLRKRKADIESKVNEYKQAREDGATGIELEARQQEIVEDTSRFMEDASAAFAKHEEELRMIKGLEQELAYSGQTEAMRQRELKAAGMEEKPATAPVTKPAEQAPITEAGITKAIERNVAQREKTAKLVPTPTHEGPMQKAMREAMQRKKSEIEQAAAAVETQPTEAQKEAGTYKKGHVSVQGLPIAIETPKGANRTGRDEDGNEWSTQLQDHYGYVKRTEGADGDHVDVFVSDGAESADRVFVVNQNDPNTGQFDEHKVVIGPQTAEEAKAVYNRNYDKGWNGFDSVVEMSVPEFKSWLKTSTKKAVQQADVAKLAPVGVGMAPRTATTAVAEPKLRKGGKEPPKLEVPKPEEKRPVVVMGRVEREVAAVFDENKEPTAKQVGAVFGSPKPRKGKEKLDENVKPVAFKTLKKYLDWAIKNDHDGDWYRQFGTGIAAIVGDPNMHEASILFGITSAQNSAENNLADMLHIMTVARQVDPVAYEDKFRKALREGTRPDGQKLKITGAQIDKVVSMYQEGTIEGGLKVTSYMQNIKDAALNLFSPHTVQDVHMARVFGYNFRDVDPKSGNVVDSAKFPSDAAIRYAQYQTMQLAQEYNLRPHEVQAYLWFYSKKNLAPTKEVSTTAKVGAGTWDSAKAYSAKEIAAAEAVIDKAQPISKVFIDPKAPGYKSTVISDPYSNTEFNDQLMELARKRAPKAVVSLTPGTERGLNFVDVTFDELRQYSRDVLEAITDDIGQIKILRQMGIPHEVEEIVGTWDRMEPSFQIRLPGGNLEDARQVASLLGDAFLQDAAIAAQPDPEGRHYGVVIRKKDKTPFTEVDLSAIYDKVNVQHSVEGLNFSTTADGLGLKFIDGSFFDGTKEYTDDDLVSFIEQIVNALGTDEFKIETFAQKGDMYDTGNYEAEIEKTWSRYRKQERSDLQRAAQRDLYKPVRGVYDRWYRKLQSRAEEKRPLASPVSLSRLTNPEAAQQEIYGRFGTLSRGSDTTNDLKIYNLDPLIEKPEKIDALLNEYGFSVKYFSFHEDPAAGVKFTVPKLKKEPYGKGVLWIYDPRVAHGSFKDEQYTRAWRIVHELGHAITERIMQKRYGDSRREGRMGRTWDAVRGHPGKRQVTVELEPLTLNHAQRAVEWEDVSFRVQRYLMEDLGIDVNPADFGREYNTNIADAIHRVLTGDFGDPGEYGFVPRETMPPLKGIMNMLESTEKAMAKDQGREPTKGINMSKWERFTEDQLRKEMAAQKKITGPLLSKTGKGAMSPAELTNHIKQLTSRWKGAQNIRVVNDYTMLPPRLKAYVEQQEAQDQADGIFDPHTGQVYLVANNIGSTDQATKVIFHEVLGHGGLRAVFGNDIVPFLKQVWDAKKDDELMQKIVTDYGIDTNDANDRLVAAEEWLAITQESLPKDTWVRQLLSFIKQLLRKIHAGLKVTDAEIHGALGRMRGQIINGGPLWRQAVETLPMFSRASDPWFSQMNVVLTNKLPGKGTGASYLETIKAFANKGQFKQEELEWSGLPEWLEENAETKLTKTEVLDYLRDSMIDIQEIGSQPNVPREKAIRDMFDVYYSDTYHGYVAWNYEEGDYETNSVTGHVLSYDTEEDAYRDLEEMYETVDHIEAERTKYHEYQLDDWGDKQNYREILFTLPRVPGKYQSGHWSTPNIVAHVRVNERIDTRGKKVLFIEEVQSDWHQQGRKKGYSKFPTKEVVKVYNPSSDEVHTFDTMKEAMEYKKELRESGWSEEAWMKVDRVPDYDLTELPPGYKLIDGNEEARQAGYKVPEDFAEHWRYEGPDIHSRNFSSKERAIASAWSHFEASGGKVGLPDAPFKQTWPLLAMKRMFRYAAENGFDSVAWTTGSQQADRYNLAKDVDGISVYARDVDKEEGVDRRVVISLKRESIPIELHVDDKGLIVADNYQQRFVGKDLEDVIGKDITDKVMGELENDLGYFKGDDLKIGGKGMRAFYDQMLPAMVDKYVKKWGAKTGKTGVSPQGSADRYEILPAKSGKYWVVRDTMYGGYRGGSYTSEEEAQALIDKLTSGTEVHSLDITDQMRTSVMQGQPLFSRGTNRNNAERPEASDAAIDGLEDENNRTFKERVQSVIDRMDRKINGFSQLTDLSSYLEHRGRLQALIQQGQDTARHLYNSFKDLTEAEALNVFEYLTDRDVGAGIITNEEARTEAIKAKNLINAMGRMMVERGIIPEASYQNYESRYLPRVYLAYLLGDKAIKTLGAGKKLSKQGYAKKRKESLTAEYREVVLGEIKDPAFLVSRAIGIPSRDLAVMEFFEKILANPNWVLQDQLVEIQIPGTNVMRQVTPFWLANEASRLRAMASQLKEGNDQRNKMESLASQYEELAAEASSDRQFDVKEYEQIPDTPQYGVLRGLIVKRAIYKDIAESGASLQDNPDAWMKLFGQGGAGTKITQMWKVMKVSLNPPSQIRNLVSNWVLLNLSGVPIHKMPYYLARAAGEMARGGKFYDVAKEFGITAGTFSANELAAIEREFLNYKARNKGKMSITGLLDLAGAIIEKAGDIYQHAEVLSKVAKIMHEMEEKGTDPALAAQEANKWLFDYSAVSEFIRTARNAPVGIPFLTFYMKVLPRLLEVAATAPWRFVPYYLMLKGMAVLAAAVNDVDDDDVEKLKMALPEWLRERGHAVIWPWKDSEGRWAATNLGYFFPWTAWTDLGQDVGEVSKSLVTGQPFEARNILQGTGVFGSPLANLISASMTNIDPFTRKEIVRDGDLPHQQMLARLSYLYTLMAPPWMTPGGPLAKIAQAGSGYRDRWGNPQPSLAEATARTVGINIYPIEPERSRSTNLVFMKRDIEDIKSRMRYELRDPNLSADDRRKLRENFKEQLRYKTEQIKRYKELSQVHPNLK